MYDKQVLRKMSNISMRLCNVLFTLAMLGGSLVTTAWRIRRLRVEGSPPGTEGICEDIE
jgi:hypothetical protein